MRTPETGGRDTIMKCLLLYYILLSKLLDITREIWRYGRRGQDVRYGNRDRYLRHKSRGIRSVSDHRRKAEPVGYVGKTERKVELQTWYVQMENSNRATDRKGEGFAENHEKRLTLYKYRRLLDEGEDFVCVWCRVRYFQQYDLLLRFRSLGGCYSTSARHFCTSGYLLRFGSCGYSEEPKNKTYNTVID